MPDRNGKRKTREQLSKRRVPELGYYFIVTDTKETEQNYLLGLRDSIPKELQGKLVIKRERYNPPYSTKDKIVNLPECSVAIHSSSQGRVPLGDLGSV